VSSSFVGYLTKLPEKQIEGKEILFDLTKLHFTQQLFAPRLPLFPSKTHVLTKAFDDTAIIHPILIHFHRWWASTLLDNHPGCWHYVIIRICMMRKCK